MTETQYEEMTVKEAAALLLTDAPSTESVELAVASADVSTATIDIVLVPAKRDHRKPKYEPRPATMHIWYDEHPDTPVFSKMGVAVRDVWLAATAWGTGLGVAIGAVFGFMTLGIA